MPFLRRRASVRCERSPGKMISSKSASRGSACEFQIEPFAPSRLIVTMDERRTLRLLALVVGGVVGILFILNAYALAGLPQHF
jgi:hypothetical protein